MRIKFLIFFIYPSLAFSSPWINISDQELNNFRNGLSYYCSKNFDFSFSPVRVSDLYDLINENKNKSKECIEYLDIFKIFLDSQFIRNSHEIRIQSNADKFYLNEAGNRVYREANILYKKSSVNQNYAYQLTLRKFENDLNFDDSYISYLINEDFVLKAGLFDKWWSPSKNSSLILSNSARPFPKLSLATYKKIQINSGPLRFLKSYDFDIFIGRLENNRTIPKALVFGNRVSFNPSNNFVFSFLRVSQFGGKGRDVNFSIVKNMILGKDTVSGKLSSKNQPGNQIAGIDFLYQNKFSSNNFYKIYGQFLGEDGPDPLNKTLNFIKFPSKRFGLLGIDLSINNVKGENININVEHINTNTGFDNVTYNHSIYKSGYRYYKQPIGASIGTDSTRNIFSIKRSIINNNLISKFQFEDIKLNQNYSEYSKWGSLKEFKKASIELSLKLNDRIDISTAYIYRDKKIGHIKKDLFLIELTIQL